MEKNIHQLFPFPENGGLVEETPPTFCFVKEEGKRTYTVLVRKKQGDFVLKKSTEQNYVIPEKILPPGEYQWNLICDQEERGWWDFKISEHAVHFLRMSAQEVFDCVPNVRPRHLFFREDLEEIRKIRKRELETFSEHAVHFLRMSAQEVFDCVPNVRPRHLFFREDLEEIRKIRKRELETLKRNIDLACSRPLPTAPMFHRDEDALPYREYFGRYRDYCDRDMVACALGYVLLGDEEAGEKAKELFLTICDWNPLGPCSLIYPWNDEIGLSNARCLPVVYDLIRDKLSKQQIYLAEKTIEAYALQCETRLEKLDFTANPGDSHAGRIPAYMGDAG